MSCNSQNVKRTHQKVFKNNTAQLATLRQKSLIFQQRKSERKRVKVKVTKAQLNIERGDEIKLKETLRRKKSQNGAIGIKKRVKEKCDNETIE